MFVEKEIEEKGVNTVSKKPPVSIIVIIILILVILGMGIFILYDKEIIFSKNKMDNTSKKMDTKNSNPKKDLVKNEEESKTNDESTSTNKNSDEVSANTNKIDGSTIRNLDFSKCLNCSNSSYRISIYHNADGLSAKISENRKSVILNVNWEIYNRRFGSMYSTTGAPSYDITNFTQEVADVYIGGFGQSFTGDTILFLMNDGTVEYMPVVKGLQGYVKNYGKVNGVSDVVKFLTADCPGSVTTLAVRSDGSIYDLQSILMSTGNY